MDLVCSKQDCKHYADRDQDTWLDSGQQDIKQRGDHIDNHTAAHSEHQQSLCADSAMQIQEVAVVSRYQPEKYSSVPHSMMAVINSSTGFLRNREHSIRTITPPDP